MALAGDLDVLRTRERLSSSTPAERLSGRTSNVLPLEVRELAESCKGLGYLVVDPQDRVVDYLQKNQLGNLALLVSPQDPHPSALRHWLVGEELAAPLQRANALSTPDTTVLQDSPAGEREGTSLGKVDRGSQQ